MVKVAEIRELESYAEALQDAQSQATIEEEIRAFAINEKWDVVDPPLHYKQIRCKWVYKVKYYAKGSVNRCKHQLVAKGYTQTHEINYNERFAPVAKMVTVRVVLVVAASKGWNLHQMDVKNVFLQGNLEAYVHMVQPPLISIRDESTFCRPKKSLYVY